MQSNWPLSSKNSERWNPGGNSCLMVLLITRGPAKPISAPGSARVRSQTEAKEAVTPPVVGLVCTQMEKPPALLSSARAEQVLAICIRDSMPSCMRAPPELVNTIRGRLRTRATSAARDTFSPTTSPMDPPRNLKSRTASTTGRPRMLPVPQIRPSFSPLFSIVRAIFSE